MCDDTMTDDEIALRAAMGGSSATPVGREVQQTEVGQMTTKDNDCDHVPRRRNECCRSLLACFAFGVAMSTLQLAVSARAEAQSAPKVQFIGTASMSDDGTVTLRLTMTSDGKPADAVITYKVGDPRYEEVLRHLGGLRPGQIKPVPSWE